MTLPSSPEPSLTMPEPLTLPEQFTRLLEKEREAEAVAFLRGLDPAARKRLVPHLKQLAKEYDKYVPHPFFGNSSYQRKASPKQAHLLNLAAFVCFSRADYEKHPFTYFPGTAALDGVLEWYCPDWFSDFVNGYGQRGFTPHFVHYDWVMGLADRGLVEPGRELIARLLPGVLSEPHDKGRRCGPDLLLVREVTLREHIWYLFEQESAVHWMDQYARYGGTPAKDQGWTALVKKLAAEGKLDRARLLKESLLATTRNFNKALSGWFAELFIQLAPTEAELLALQEDLFVVFNARHPKPVNTALGYLKKLADAEGFHAEGFLENTPLLLASNTKSVVATTLTILEKLARRRPARRAAACEAAGAALVHNDDALQAKAAKLIGQYGDPASASLRGTLAPYAGVLRADARAVLQPFLPEPGGSEAAGPVVERIATAARLRPEAELPPVHTFDALLYLASQAFDNNASYHFDLLPAALIRLHAQVTGKHLAKLEPVLQRAYKLLFNGGAGNAGRLDHLLALFFVEYALVLMQAHPEDAATLRQLHETYVRKDEESKRQSSWYTPRLERLAGWTAYEKDTLYLPHQQLLLDALQQLQLDEPLPLLSTPTHAPGWLAPAALVERLAAYQARGIAPGELDLQVALCRCAPEGAGEGLGAARQQLTGEFRRLLEFAWSDAAPAGPFTFQAAWVVAGVLKNPAARYDAFVSFGCQTLSRSYLTGQFAWQTVAEVQSQQWYDYVARLTVAKPYTRKVLRLEPEAAPRPEAGWRALLPKWLAPEPAPACLLPELLRTPAAYWMAHPHDCRRLLLLMPAHPEPFLAQTVLQCLSYGDTAGDTGKQGLVATLQTLHEIWGPLGDMAHLFVATCMTGSDKTVRAFAAQIWVDGVAAGTINSERIGEILGTHQRVAFAPVKRLTDLLGEAMLRVSARHDRALESLLTHLLVQLPAQPVGNLKKLLEIYRELRSLHGSRPGRPELAALLAAWKSAPSLRKVIAALETEPAARLAA